MYIPKLIPEEDRKIIEEKYRKGIAKHNNIGKRPALLVVDMTNGFVEDKFPTGYSRTGKPRAISIKRLIDYCRTNGISIIYTRDMEEIGEVYSLYRGAWNNKSNSIGEEMRQEYNRIYPLITPLQNELVIQKSKPSAFFGTSLISILNYLRIDSLIVTGMVTSGCIRATVVDAFSYNFNVTIPLECVANRSQISHEVALFDMDTKYANVISLQETIALLEKLKT
ncbi:MAG: isochorismatase family cysteine hydrolase [Candidatus Parvarchaeota archaeon]